MGQSFVLKAREKNEIAVEYVKIADLKPNPYSPRDHNGAQKEKLESLIRHYGIIRPIEVDRNRMIIDGVAVVAAARKLGYDEIPVVVVSHLTPRDIRGLRLALNRVPEDAGWDTEKLRQEFEELIALGREPINGIPESQFR